MLTVLTTAVLVLLSVLLGGALTYWFNIRKPPLHLRDQPTRRGDHLTLQASGTPNRHTPDSHTKRTDDSRPGE